LRSISHAITFPAFRDDQMRPTSRRSSSSVKPALQASNRISFRCWTVAGQTLDPRGTLLLPI